MHINYHNRFLITVISQPGDTTICKGEETVFTCVLDLTNSHTRYTDLEWYTFTNTSNIELLDPHEERINFLIRTTGSTISSSLNIINAVSSYTGYFWVGTPSFSACNVSLTVLAGTSAYVASEYNLI